MKLLNKKDVGQRRVYDIEVEDVHNFYANGVNVHNCATDGGVSVIKDDGTVVDSADTAPQIAVAFNDTGILAFTRGGNTNRIAETYDADGFGSDDLFTLIEGYIPFGVTGLVFPSSERVRSGAVGLERLHLDTSALAGSLHSFTTSTYNTGWMNGDIKGAFLSDTDDTDLVGSGELVTNGTFDTDSDWTKGTGWTISGGAANKAAGTGDAITQSDAGMDEGALYAVSYTVSGATSGICAAILTADSQVTGNLVGGNGDRVEYLRATTGVDGFGITANADFDGSIDNVSVKLADEDRSVNNNGLIVNGTVTREPVAPGADLVAYSGFSSTNYLEQPYNPDLDFGTGDFCVMGWVDRGTDGFGVILDRSDGTSVGRFKLDIFPTTTVEMRLFLESSTYVDTTLIPQNRYSFLCAVRRSGSVEFYLNGVLSSSHTATDDIDGSVNKPKMTVGIREDLAQSLEGSLALLRISATAPTPEQIKRIYEDEKVLFQENAQATLYGTSDAVTALAHDPVTDLLHVGTSDGRSVFQGLRRVDNTTDAVSTAISASNNLIVEQ